MMKFKGFQTYFIICFLLPLILSCKKTKVDPVDVGYCYYPANIGHWVLYDVDSTFYNNFTHTVVISHFQIKEYIESTYADNQNRPTERIERYKIRDSLPYYLKDVWTSTLTPSTAERVEENIRYVKLVFPIEDGKTWNGNAFNYLDPQDYNYVNIFKPYSIKGITFDSTVTVIQTIDSNLVGARLKMEVYANNVGLIYKRYRDVKKQPNPLHDSIISGVDYSMRIVTFGN
jgi:hypothetical protein